MQILDLKAYPQESNDIREHLILRGFLEGIENSRVRLELRKNLGDADMTLEKALERALFIEAVTRNEEENIEPRLSSAIQPNSNTQLINSINSLVPTLQNNQANMQDKQKFLSHGARSEEFLRGSERSSRESGDRKRNHNSYNRSSADSRRTNYDIRAKTEDEIGRTRVLPSRQRQR